MNSNLIYIIGLNKFFPYKIMFSPCNFFLHILVLIQNYYAINFSPVGASIYVFE